MAPASSLLLLVISNLALLSLAEEKIRYHDQSCPPVSCGILGQIQFPFSTRTNPECGLLVVDNCNEQNSPKIQLGKNGPQFLVTDIKMDNTLQLHDLEVEKPRQNRSCMYLKNLTLATTAYLSYNIISNGALFKCHSTQTVDGSKHTKSYKFCNESCHSLVYSTSGFYSRNCSLIPLLVKKTPKSVEFLNLFTGSFYLQVNVTEECLRCHWKTGGQCQSDDEGNFHCSNAETGDKNVGLKLGLGIGIGGLVVLTVVLPTCIKRRWKKRKYAPSNLHSSSIVSSKSDLEGSSVDFGVPIFSYNELAEATNNFNHEKMLAVGGFGTVYYGKLRDGREVAIKYLYGHSYRKVELFMNEIKILTQLRQKNLILLYGYTSHHSQNLLLVYEFIPNGTVADHLHGDRANPCLLTWPIRMNIAIETATALAYLHVSDIIHRDVKTSNILLDNNFCVKVADFGLSRFFPTDVTHVSTAPQGTPGYVDLEYYKYYQLTDKSDVYSFGVVLIELISSMSAVDVSRHNDEINLAILAINKIQNHAVDELIDPCLGFHSDEEVKRMATSVAELAFLCLQQKREMRPTMDVVLKELQRIKSGECKSQSLKEEDDNDKEEFKSMQQPPPLPTHTDEAALLMTNIKQLPPSPISGGFVTATFAH